MKALQDLDIFVRTVDSGSLSATARALDLTPAAVSAAVKRLEAELGATLFVRTTRSLRLTPEGERFLARCRPALETLREGVAELADARRPIRGTLRVAAPSDLGRHRLLDWLEAFRARHPQLRYSVQLSDRLSDIQRQPLDLALRYGVPPEDARFIALPLAPRNARVLCAAPSYLKRRGAPTHPRQLRDHHTLCFMTRDAVHDRWQFQRGKEKLHVRVADGDVANDGEVVRRWALAGRGIAYKSRIDVADDLASGRLKALCVDWRTEPTPLYLICADRRLLTPAVAALRDFLAGHCQRLAADAD